jgi:hypothetical protein
MDSFRPKRATRKPKRYSKSPERTLKPIQLAHKKANRQTLSEALKPIAVEPIPNPTILDSPLPTYVPLIELPFILGRGISRDVIELQTFQKFILKRVVDIIMTATNSYAERKQAAKPSTLFTRPWKNITFTEIIRYIRCLVYIEMHIEAEHALY